MTLVERIQKLKAKKGFTLVELIVVIAILAVLMAILVPTMLGWVKDSRITAADSTADQIKNAYNSVITKLDVKGYNLTLKDGGYYGGKKEKGKITLGIKNTDFAGKPDEADSTALIEEVIKDVADNSYWIFHVKNGGIDEVYWSQTSLAASRPTFVKDGEIAGNIIVGSSPKVTV